MGGVDVAPMGVGVTPILELLDWGRGGLRYARDGITATGAVGRAAAAIKISATALIVSATPAAIVVSTTTTGVVGAMTAADSLSLLALALLLVTMAAACSTILAVLLLWVLAHAGGGLVADEVAEHLN